MSGIKAPLQDVLSRLGALTITNGDGQTAALYTRVWNNQLNYERKGQLYDFQKPACFVEITSGVQFGDIGLGYRSADLGWRIHLVHEFYHDGENYEQDLAVFDLRDRIISLLENYQPTSCSNMVAVVEDMDYEHDSLYHYVIGFACNFIDSKGSKDDQGAFIFKQPPTDIVDNATLVPSITPYIPDGSYFTVPQN